jgi:hypothetical protein
MDFLGTEGNDSLVGTTENDFFDGSSGNDTLFGLGGNDLIIGGEGDDLLFGNSSDTITIGSDTLEGGAGNDGYFISLSAGGGSLIQDEEGDFSVVLIGAENTDLNAIANIDSNDTAQVEAVFTDPATWGDSFIEISTPQAGIVGLEKSGTDLIIDLDRDGLAEAENDLTITNYFNEDGTLGAGAPVILNNILDPQAVVDLFAGDTGDTGDDSILGTTVYRFFNNDTGVHFYTANEAEKENVETLANYSFEGASYSGVDPLSGEGVPVYRFLNEDTGVHLYTVSEAERDTTENLDNFSYEGEAFLAYDTPVEGSIPIYRFYNADTGAHFYTSSTAERDNVENNLSDFQAEGIAYYALPETTADDGSIADDGSTENLTDVIDIFF